MLTLMLIFVSSCTRRRQCVPLPLHPPPLHPPPLPPPQRSAGLPLRLLPSAGLFLLSLPALACLSPLHRCVTVLGCPLKQC